MQIDDSSWLTLAHQAPMAQRGAHAHNHATVPTNQGLVVDQIPLHQKGKSVRLIGESADARCRSQRLCQLAPTGAMGT